MKHEQLKQKTGCTSVQRFDNVLWQQKTKFISSEKQQIIQTNHFWG
jgi:hypothetical protein